MDTRIYLRFGTCAEELQPWSDSTNIGLTAKEAARFRLLIGLNREPAGWVILSFRLLVRVLEQYEMKVK